MSPDYRKNSSEKQTQGKILFHDGNGVLVEDTKQEQKSFDETMSFTSVTASIKGHSILDVGHAQIQKLQLQVSDSSAIVLSGDAVKKVH